MGPSLTKRACEGAWWESEGARRSSAEGPASEWAVSSRRSWACRPAAYGLVALLTFGEAAAFVGLVLPGELAVLLGGVVASGGNASLSVMIAVASAAAIAGNSVGYEIVRRSSEPPTICRTRAAGRSSSGVGRRCCGRSCQALQAWHGCPTAGSSRSTSWVEWRRRRHSSSSAMSPERHGSASSGLRDAPRYCCSPSSSSSC
jgi:hypothetical protein